jgi:hypothetical protein
LRVIDKLLYPTTTITSSVPTQRKVAIDLNDEDDDEPGEIKEEKITPKPELKRPKEEEQKPNVLEPFQQRRKYE